MTSYAANRLSLVADIGGTNTRVALADGTKLLPKTIAKFANKDFDDLQSVLADYIRAQGNVDCAGACVAVAGPVRDGVGALTNLDWALDRAALIAATRAEKVAILNDLQAQGHAIGYLEQASVTPLIPGPQAPPHAASLVVGVGTGFNVAVIYDPTGLRLVPPSEAGHADLPIRSYEDLELAQFVSNGGHFPAIDDLMSGRGLEQIYDWLGQKSDQNTPKKAAQIMASVGAGDDPRAVEAARYMARLLGTVVGNLALVHLPFGGIYLIGGVARALAPYLGDFGFEAAMKDKGRFAPFMDNFALNLISDDNAALIGCAHYLSVQS